MKRSKTELMRTEIYPGMGPRVLEMPKEYFDQIRDMRQRVLGWTKDNPDKEVKIQFNVPEGVFAISAICDALDNKLIVANESGQELLDIIWPLPADPKKEPTVFMVRMALEGWEDEK